MCKLCNNSDPSWVRINYRIGKAKNKEMEIVWEIIKDYTGMYPCRKVRGLFSEGMLNHSKKSIDDVIIDKLFKAYANRNQVLELNPSIRRTGENHRYESKSRKLISVSKHICKRININTKKQTFILRILRKDIRLIKTLDTLDEAIVFRDNYLKEHT